MTNGDNIRAASDRDLTEIFFELGSLACGYCPVDCYGTREPGDEICCQMLLDWLGEEIDDD